MYFHQALFSFGVHTATYVEVTGEMDNGERRVLSYTLQFLASDQTTWVDYKQYGQIKVILYGSITNKADILR